MTIVDAAGANGTYWLEIDASEDRLAWLTGYWRGSTGRICYCCLAPLVCDAFVIGMAIPHFASIFDITTRSYALFDCFTLEKRHLPSVESGCCDRI
jgi:hypothetical protein